MNFLAHLLLSGSDLDIQVGGLLGDFVKGPLQGNYPEKVEQGIRLHRHIDTLTARLPDMTQLYTLFESPWRRYAGIVVDVAFDHLLAQRWQHYHTLPLTVFCANFYRHLAIHRQWLPERAQQFSDRAPQIRWLESYADPDIMITVLDRVGDRFKRPVPLGECWRYVTTNRDCFDHAFSYAIQELAISSERFLTEISTTEALIKGQPTASNHAISNRLLSGSCGQAPAVRLLRSNL